MLLINRLDCFYKFKKVICVISFFYMVLHFMQLVCGGFQDSVQTFDSKHHKPKILVLTSKGGEGHMSACAALNDIFPNYEIKYFYPIHDYFHSFFDGEAWYTSSFQNGWVGATNLLIRYPGKIFFKMTTRAFKKRFLQIIDEEKPDMLISVIPLINYSAALAANQRSLPFVIVTLDADLDLWLLNMECIKTHNFTMTVRAKTPRIETQIACKKIPMTCVHEVGAPLRREFFQTKDKTAIKSEWKIPDNKKVVLLMRGGTGSVKLIDYVRSLVKLDSPLHLLVCVGRNEKLIPKLKKIKSKGPVSFSIVPYTKKIPDLMAISDLLVSQPSPNVSNEAMFMNLPVLVDMSSRRLYWENATIDWFKINGSVKIFKRMKQMNKFVVELLENGNTAKPHNADDWVDFTSEIRKTVKGLLSNDKI